MKDRFRFINRIVITLFLMSGVGAFSDDTFNSMISSGKYREALDYADEKLPPADRDEAIWIKLAVANDALGLSEKALACYMVSWRLNAKSYDALYGIARLYNKLNQSENALTWAQKALEINFTAEASWEYARACIALGRAPEAKKALEKVIQTDSGNDIANRELGKIYVTEKDWVQALPLLKKSYAKKPDQEVMYQIGKASLETGAMDSAVLYLSKVTGASGAENVMLELAQAYYGIKRFDYSLSTYSRVPSGKLTAEDLYRIASAKEVTTGADVWQEYEAAVNKFGQSKSIEALKARTKVGAHFIKSKKFGDAVSQFRFILDADPQGKIIPDVHVLLAEAQQGSGDLTGGIATLEKAIAADKKNVEAYVLLGDFYSLNKMPDKAKSTWETLITLSPNDPDIYLKLGMFSLKSGKFTEAIAHFEKSIAIKKTAEALAGIATAHMKLTNVDKAIDAGLRALEVDKSNRDAHDILAHSYFSKKDYKNAEIHFEFLTRLEPTNLEYLHILATSYEMNSASGKLYDIDKKIVELSNTNVDSRKRLARRADSLKLVDSALSFYSQLAILVPTHADVFKRLFELSIVKNQRNDVVTYFGKYIALKQDDANAYKEYGDFLYEQKDYDNALNAYRKSLSINPSIKGFHKRYAEIVIAKGQEDEVITALGNVIKNNEADLGTYTTLGMIYQKKKMYSKSIEMYQKALQLEPSSADALTALAVSQALNGDLNGAVVSYEQALMMNDKLIDEYRELGDIYSKLSRREESVKAYTKYFERNSTDLAIAKILGENAFEKKAYADAVKYLGALGLQAESKYLIMYSESFVAQQKYDAAVMPLEKLRVDKKKLDNNQLQTVLRMLALTYETLGKKSDASIIYEEYLSLPNVRDPDIAYKRAGLVEQTDTLKALKIYEANSKSYPADYRNFLRAGLLYASSTTTLEKSVTLLKRVTELASGVPEVWLEMGRAYRKLQRSTEELDAYKKYAETNPQSFEANSRIGILFLQQGKINEGLVYLELANTLKPNDSETMVALADGYMRTERTNEAIDLLEKAKKQKADDPQIRAQLFELYKMIRKNDLALSEIKGLVEMKREPEFLVKYAVFLSSIGKQKEALETVEEVLAIESDNLDVLMLKAKFLRKNKKFDDAIEIYKEISTFLPDHVQSMFERAETYLEQSKPQWAETFYARVLRTDPQFALAELGLAKIAKLLKNDAEYKTRLEKARALDPTNKLILDEISSSTKK